jgi:UDP-3-O-[3-hydroxymyristoyl] glucosamine N-acyltransferase
LVRLGDLARSLGLDLVGGDPDVVLSGVSSLTQAGSSDLAFIADKKYLAELASTGAGCVILREEWAVDSPVAVLCAPDPYLAYARASRLFEAGATYPPGVHPTAVIHPEVEVPASASIGPHVSIEEGAILGDGVTIAAGCRIGPRVRLGAQVWLGPNVVIYHEVVLGERVRVHANTVLGADGFGFARHAGGWERISQLGTVIIGDDVDIGASSTIDRGAVGDTVVEEGVIIDDQVHIAHNCRIGARTAIAGCVGIAGSVIVGENCTFAGQVGVSGHLEICDNAHFAGQARLTSSVTEAGAYCSGTPLEPMRQWGRNAVRFTQLNELHKRVAELEARLEKADNESRD